MLMFYVKFTSVYYNVPPVHRPRLILSNTVKNDPLETTKERTKSEDIQKLVETGSHTLVHLLLLTTQVTTSTHPHRPPL